MEQNLRDKIISLAAKMYAEEGLKAVRMDDIARRIGISKRTLYEIVGDKAELIYHAIRLHFSYHEKMHSLIANEAPNCLVAILRVLHNIVQNSKTNWRLHNALLKFHPAIERRIFEEDLETHQKEFRKFLQRGISEGLFIPRINLDLTMITLQYIASSVVVEGNGLILPEGITPQRAFMELTTNVMRGISTPKGIEIIDEYMESGEWREF